MATIYFNDGQNYFNIGTVLYPVGSIYESFSTTSPAELFGGIWVQFTNKFLYGVAIDKDAKQTGGANTHKLTTNELPKHRHSLYSARLGTEENAGSEPNPLEYIPQNTQVTNKNKDLYTEYTGGGLRTTICQLILLDIIGTELPSFYAIGSEL